MEIWWKIPLNVKLRTESALQRLSKRCRHFWGYRSSGLLYLPPFVFFALACTNNSHTKICLFLSPHLSHVFYRKFQVHMQLPYFFVSHNGSGITNGFLSPAPTASYPWNIYSQIKATVKLLKGRQERGYGVPALGNFSTLHIQPWIVIELSAVQTIDR